jgi:hypothetical protein
MTIRGRVKNGVVILDDGARIPEGEEVTILTPDRPSVSSPGEGSRPHSVLDISPISLGPVLRMLTPDDDLLGEMLEGRP